MDDGDVFGDPFVDGIAAELVEGDEGGGGEIGTEDALKVVRRGESEVETVGE